MHAVQLLCRTEKWNSPGPTVEHVETRPSRMSWHYLFNVTLLPAADAQAPKRLATFYFPLLIPPSDRRIPPIRHPRVNRFSTSLESSTTIAPVLHSTLREGIGDFFSRIHPGTSVKVYRGRSVGGDRNDRKIPRKESEPHAQ